MSSSQFKTRLRDIQRFYELLDALEVCVGGKRTLESADGRMNWPRQGVYFFFELGEERVTSGAGPRVVRVGTHAPRAGGTTTLWGRLRQHRGTLRGSNPGGGKHRSSIFRKHIGAALIHRDRWPKSIAGYWGVGSDAEKPILEREYPLEQAVSQHIRSMPFLWMRVNDELGFTNLRVYIERNTIALLSNYNSQDTPIDPPSATWLGHWAASEKIRHSGLWNANHVQDDYDPGLLDTLQELAAQEKGP
ncbi:MAG: hypothetical protein IMY86_12690 [Chloroflexi bacterium]|nr:hypothetical protein [Chloroflexota bacterium]